MKAQPIRIFLAIFIVLLTAVSSVGLLSNTDSSSVLMSIARFSQENVGMLTLLCAAMFAASALLLGKKSLLYCLLCVLNAALLNREAINAFWAAPHRRIVSLVESDRTDRILLGVFILLAALCILWMIHSLRGSPPEDGQADPSKPPVSGDRQPVTQAAFVMTLFILIGELLNGNENLQLFQDLSMNFFVENSFASLLLMPLIVFLAVFAVFNIIAGFIRSDKTPSWSSLLEKESPKIGYDLMALAIGLLEGFINLLNHLLKFGNMLTGLLFDDDRIFPNLAVGASGSISITTPAKTTNAGYVNNSLLYPVAGFSLISLYTTAKGMQEFVFSENQAWLAYIASCSVQTILICGGLGACHIHSVIANARDSKKSIKVLLHSSAAILFASMLLVSSSFSYVYIATIAYRDSWAGDTETKVGAILVSSTEKLNQENERRGAAYADEFFAGTSALRPVVEQYLTTKRNDVATLIVNLHPEKHVLKNLSIESTVDALKKQYPSYSASLEVLCGNYNMSFLSPLRDAAAGYNAVVQAIQSLSSGGSFKADLDSLVRTLTELNAKIEVLSSGIDTFQSYIAQKDLDPVKSSYRVEAALLQGKTNTLLEALSRTAASAQGNGNTEDLMADIDMLERQSLLWKSGQVGAANPENAAKLASELLQKLSASGALTTEQLRSLIRLSDSIKGYGASVKLADDIHVFQKSRLSTTYCFSGKEAIDTELWRELRNSDFYTLIDLNYALPALPDNAGPSDYNADEALEDLLRTRRNLLGDYTTFERAMGYFDSDYKMMAYVSMFIALLFDLSSFMLGCCFYVLQSWKRTDSAGRPSRLPRPRRANPQNNPSRKNKG